MLFAIYCLDKPFSAALRAVTRDEHLAFIAAAEAVHVHVAGPLLNEDGQKMIGSMLIVECDTLENVQAWAANDPYRRVGLFEVADIRPWKGRGVTPIAETPAP